MFDYRWQSYYTTCKCGAQNGHTAITCCGCGKRLRPNDGRTWGRDRKKAAAKRKIHRHLTEAIRLAREYLEGE